MTSLAASQQRGHVRRIGAVWHLYYRASPAPGVARRLVSRRLGTVDEMPTAAAARRAADRVMAQIEPRALHAGTVVSWAEWCRTYMARHLVLLSKGSRSTRKSIIERHLIVAPALAGRAVHAIDEPAIQQWITDQRIAGVATTTIRARFALLRRMLRAALEAGLAAHPPRADRMEFPRDEVVHATLRAKAFSPPEVDRILDEAEEPLRTACALARYLGLRCSEVVGLTWSAIDLEQGRVEIRQQALGGEVRPLKSSSSRATLTMPRVLIDVLRAYLARPEAAQHDLLFPAPDGRPMDGAALRGQLHALLDRLGIRRRGFHGFRHACALGMAQTAVGPEALRRAMRHASLRTTAVYLSATSEDVAAALNASASVARVL